MSEEQIQEAETQESQVQEEYTPEQLNEFEVQKPIEQEKENKKPNGFDPVDFKTASPEEIEARFNRLYGQVKGNQRDLSEYRRLSGEQSQIIQSLEQRLQELQGGMGKVVEHLETKTYADTETQLKSQIRYARENGDWDSYDQLQERLVELKAQKILKSQQPKQPPQTEQRLHQVRNAAEVADYAVGQGEFTRDDALAVEAWMSEADETGSRVRPWSYADSPEYQYAFQEARSVFTNPKYAKMTTTEKLAEIDRRMGVKTKGFNQPVMGGGLTQPKKTSNVRLSPETEKFVVRTKFGGAKYKTDAERIEAYKKQLQAYKSKGGRQ